MRWIISTISVARWLRAISRLHGQAHPGPAQRRQRRVARQEDVHQAPVERSDVVALGHRGVAVGDEVDARVADPVGLHLQAGAGRELEALDELLAAGKQNDSTTEYGERAPLDLARMVESGVPLRLGAVEHNEIRAVLDFANKREVRVILDKANEAGRLADEIAESGVGVIFRVPYVPNFRSVDRGKSEDARWYDFDVPSRLAAAGASFAITGTNPRDLLFLALSGFL